MYLTAHRVRARDGRRGVNVALYLHEGTGIPADIWSRPPREVLTLVTTLQPGRRTSDRVTVAPGGNSVESYLDVVGPDGTPLATIERVLTALRAEVPLTSRAFAQVGDVLAEFGVNLGEADRLAHFDELQGRACDLYADPSPPPWMGREPLTVNVATDEDGWRFQLDEPSAARIARHSGSEIERTTLGIRFDVADDFRSLYGSLYPHVGEWVTGLSRDALLALGGVRFLQNGQVLALWPARP